MVALYALTMLLSAALLFVVQPMVAKMLLPALGGSSAVWTTCMLFFQVLLLAGYGYAHAGARLLEPMRQAILHLVLMVLAFFILPIAVTPELGAESSPVTWMLIELVVAVGLPFFVVSASAPMLQHWFSYTDHEDASDPYFLYAASNVGSMVALLGYPFLVEPWIGVRAQSNSWTIGFLMLILATGGCAWVLRRERARSRVEARSTSQAPIWSRRLWWIFCAFVPSSLMLGVTAYLTTDISAVPLFWVLPLALYLLTFILVFAKTPVRNPRILTVTLPWLVIVVVGLSMLRIPMWTVIAAHLALFFVVAIQFHGMLADARPAADRLTEFYLWMSFGGALGGVFNALIAPAVFDRMLEYFLVLAVAVAAIPTLRQLFEKDEVKPDAARYALPFLLIAGTVFLLWAVGFLRFGVGWRISITMVICFAGAVVTWYRPVLLHLALSAVILLGVWELSSTTGLLAEERSFFAAYRIYDREYNGHPVRKFSHGTTSHGAQSLEEKYRHEPIGYHHPVGPVGQVLDRIPHETVGVVGLGIGVMAAYAEPDTHFEFYEIDPLVEDLAREHFTYLKDCGESCSVKVGDGRLLLEDVPDGHYDVLFLDAYNSDSVPTHLLTREALQLYLSKIDDDGVLVFNVSNRFMDIESVVGSLAEDAGLVALYQLHRPRKDLRRRYVMIAGYVVAAREPEHLRTIATDARWEPANTEASVWTDDYTNIIEVFDWD